MQTATNQNGVNKTLGLFLLGLCAFYFICALGIFILPFDVLARSSLARDFVEAMLKIYPAVERAFTHTDFTQKAALYIAYMGVVKVITLVVYMGCFLCHRAGRVAMAKAVKKQSVASRAFVSIFGIFIMSNYFKLIPGVFKSVFSIYLLVRILLVRFLFLIELI